MGRPDEAEARLRIDKIMRTVGSKMGPDAQRDLQAVLELFLRGKSGDGVSWFVLANPAVSVRFSIARGRRLLEYTLESITAPSRRRRSKPCSLLSSRLSTCPG